MKIAICVGGLIRSKNNKNLMEIMRNVFPNVDFYYHTWTEYKNDISEKYKAILFNEPKVDYNPVLDPPLSKSYKHYQYKQLDVIPKKQLHATKQILGHAYMVDTLSNDYDLIVRTRWDARVSKEVDYTPYFEMAYDSGPVGFMNRKATDYNLNNPLIHEKTPQETQWYGYLPDIFIIHKPEHFDTSYVYKLHEEKLLMSAEWGWYQTMSEPYGDIHTSIQGGVIVERR